MPNNGILGRPPGITRLVVVIAALRLRPRLSGREPDQDQQSDD